MPGPSKKPIQLKTISNTTRGKKEIESSNVIDLPVVSEVPPPLPWLPNEYAEAEWRRLAPILVANKLLTEAGLSAFGALCSLHGTLAQIWAAGHAPTGHMVAQYRNLVNDFGLTPVAQGKVKPAGKDDSGNKFANNGKKTA